MAVAQLSHVLRNKDVPLATRMTILQVYILTSSAYALGTFGRLTRQQEHKFYASMMVVFRRVAITPGDLTHYTDHELLSLSRQQAPMAVLWRQRMLSYSRFLRNAPLQ